MKLANKLGNYQDLEKIKLGLQEIESKRIEEQKAKLLIAQIDIDLANLVKHAKQIDYTILNSNLSKYEAKLIKAENKYQHWLQKQPPLKYTNKISALKQELDNTNNLEQKQKLQHKIDSQQKCLDKYQTKQANKQAKIEKQLAKKQAKLAAQNSEN